MAYLPSAEKECAWIFLADDHTEAALLDLQGVYVLLDGGAKPIEMLTLFRQPELAVLSTANQSTLANAAELNKGQNHLPIIGRIPKANAAAPGPDAELIRELHRSKAFSLPGKVVDAKKPEPTLAYKSLRSGSIEVFVLNGEPKDLDNLQKAIESGDQEKILNASRAATVVSLIVWVPAQSDELVRRVLHTGNSSADQIVTCLEKLRGLPLLDKPKITVAEYRKGGTVTPKKDVVIPAPAKAAAAPTKPTTSRPVVSANVRKPSAPSSKPSTAASRPAVSTTSRVTGAPKPAAARPAPAARPIARPAAAKPSAPPSRPAATSRPAAPVRAAPAPPRNGAASNGAEKPMLKKTMAPARGAAPSKPTGGAPIKKPVATEPKKVAQEKDRNLLAAAGGAAAGLAAAGVAAAAAVVAGGEDNKKKEEDQKKHEEVPAPANDSVIILDDSIDHGGPAANNKENDSVIPDVEPLVPVPVVQPEPHPQVNEPESSVSDGLYPDLPTGVPAVAKPVEEPVPEPEAVADAPFAPAEPSAPVVPSADVLPAHFPDPEDTIKLIIEGVHPEPSAPHGEEPVSVVDSTPVVPAPRPEPDAPVADDDLPIIVAPQEPVEPSVGDVLQPVPFDEPDVAEPFVPLVPVLPDVPSGGRDPSEIDIPKDDPSVPAEFKEAFEPEKPTDDGLLEVGEPPMRMRKISMDTDDVEAEKLMTQISGEVDQAVDECKQTLDATARSLSTSDAPPEEPFVAAEAAPIDQHFGEAVAAPIDQHFGAAETENVGIDQHFGEAVAAPIDQHFGAAETENARHDGDVATNTTSSTTTTVHEDVGTRKDSFQATEDLLGSVSSPFATGLASTIATHIVDGATVEGAKKNTESLLDTLIGEVKHTVDVVEQKIEDGIGAVVGRKISQDFMRHRNSTYEQNGDKEREIVYEKTDPAIDEVLESLSTESSEVDRKLSESNPSTPASLGHNGAENPAGVVVSNGNGHEADKMVYRLLPPKANKAPLKFSKAYYVDLAFAPRHGHECALDEESALVFFTYLRATNMVLPSENLATPVLDAWLAAKRSIPPAGDFKSTLIPTKECPNLQAFRTMHEVELEKRGMSLRLALDHCTTKVEINGEEKAFNVVKVDL